MTAVLKWGTAAVLCAVVVLILAASYLMFTAPAGNHAHAPTKIEMPSHFHLEFLHGHSELHNHGAT